MKTENIVKRFIPFRLPAVAILGAFCMSFAQAGEVITLVTTPVSDGALWDSHKPWEDAPNKIVDTEMTAQAGSFYGNLSVAILEFSLPPKDRLKSSTLASARLVVSINRAAEANESTVAPIDVDVYGYDGTSADGVVTEDDWSEGKKLQRWLTKGGTTIGFGTPMPAIDVTEFVQKALNEKKAFVGFRLRPEGVEQGEKNVDGIIVRTAEFGAANGFYYTPNLVLEFK